MYIMTSLMKKKNDFNMKPALRKHECCMTVDRAVDFVG